MSQIYITVIGAWGDALAALGNATLLERANIEHFGVIYFGFDPHIKTFLELQQGVEEVVHIKPQSKEHYEEVCLMACCTENSNWKDWKPLLRTELDIEGIIIQTHITDFLQRVSPETCVRDFQCKLATEPVPFAKPTILLQPFSVQSSTFQEHWPYWTQTIDWLLENGGFDYVLVGLPKGIRPCDGEVEFVFPGVPKHPRLYNLVGKTTSMIDVLELADQSHGIITTSNCLSMWSIIRKKPALVMEAAKKSRYFSNWIRSEPNTLLEQNTPFEDFKDVCKNWLSGLDCK